MKNIAVVGSTGSIGSQALDIISENPGLFKAQVLAAGSNVERLVEQAIVYRPALAVIADESKFRILEEALKPYGVECGAGVNALVEAVTRDDVDMVLTATVGYSGLEPTLRAIDAGKDIALANKETLVVAGELVMERVRKRGVHVYPVDSEHSAIFQCLNGEDTKRVRRLIITASGGPFLHTPAEALEKAGVKDALNHPCWSMGAKITVDSATMLNKAFEIIEARWLFDIDGDRITPVVHPQSIVHSMVEFVDGSVVAQMGVHDMHLPIRYALSDATRLPDDNRRLDITDISTLTFEKPDYQRFPCLGLAKTALSLGGNAACVINAANEIANEAFRSGNINFGDIYRVIVHTLDNAPRVDKPGYDDFVASNGAARRIAAELVATIGRR